MKCYKCNEEMKCFSDVVQETVRIDWFKCPKCDSVTTVEYEPRTMEIRKVLWEAKQK